MLERQLYPKLLALLGPGYFRIENRVGIGWPDIVGPGVALEVKLFTGRLQPCQVYRLGQLAENGWATYVLYWDGAKRYKLKRIGKLRNEDFETKLAGV